MASYVKFKEVLAYRKEYENDHMKTIKLYNKIIAYISLAYLLNRSYVWYRTNKSKLNG